jgi:hypothetical protein
MSERLPDIILNSLLDKLDETDGDLECVEEAIAHELMQIRELRSEQVKVLQERYALADFISRHGGESDVFEQYKIPREPPGRNILDDLVRSGEEENGK